MIGGVFVEPRGQQFQPGIRRLECHHLAETPAGRLQRRAEKFSKLEIQDLQHIGLASRHAAPQLEALRGIAETREQSRFPAGIQLRIGQKIAGGADQRRLDSHRNQQQLKVAQVWFQIGAEARQRLVLVTERRLPDGPQRRRSDGLNESPGPPRPPGQFQVVQRQRVACGGMDRTVGFEKLQHPQRPLDVARGQIHPGEPQPVIARTAPHALDRGFGSLEIAEFPQQADFADPPWCPRRPDHRQGFGIACVLLQQFDQPAAGGVLVGLLGEGLQGLDQLRAMGGRHRHSHQFHRAVPQQPRTCGCPCHRGGRLADGIEKVTRRWRGGQHRSPDPPRHQDTKRPQQERE